MSKQKEYLIRAYKKGYKIDKDGILKNPKGNIVDGYINNDGYKETCIRFEDVNSAIIPFHRLQAYQKFGSKIFEDEIVTRHLNSNRLDNSWSNIGIGSHSDNMMDIDEDVRIEKAKHASSFIQKHNHAEIKKYYNGNDDISYEDVMEKFDITSKGTVSYIINK